MYGPPPSHKAVTQELMLYWLQQLQVKRWQHRQMSALPDSTNNNNNDTKGEEHHVNLQMRVFPTHCLKAAETQESI